MGGSFIDMKILKQFKKKFLSKQNFPNLKLVFEKN